MESILDTGGNGDGHLHYFYVSFQALRTQTINVPVQWEPIVENPLALLSGQVEARRKLDSHESVLSEWPQASTCRLVPSLTQDQRWPCGVASTPSMSRTMACVFVVALQPCEVATTACLIPLQPWEYT